MILLGCASTNKMYGPIPNEGKAIEVAKDYLINTINYDFNNKIEDIKFKVTTGYCDSTDSWIVERIFPKYTKDSIITKGGDIHITITKDKGKICECELGQ
jgi:hypothetical protein